MNPFYAEAQFEEYVRDFLSDDRYGISLEIDPTTGLFRAHAHDYDTVRNSEFQSYGTTIAAAMARAIQGLLSLDRDTDEEIESRRELSSMTNDELKAALDDAFAQMFSEDQVSTSIRDFTPETDTWSDSLIPNADGSYTLRGK